MKICGLQKTTLLDYPGHVAATIFLGGCNFRCPYCHNADLLDINVPAGYSRDEVLSFLKKRRGILEGVCITGGEPTLQADALTGLMQDIRSLDLLVKLDTNGTRPDIIRQLYSDGLLNYLAMDIKAGPDNYAAACGLTRMNLESVKESAAWLIAGTLPFEFRTTVVKGLHTRGDFEAIGPWIKGCTNYYLQNYTASERVLCPGSYTSFTKDELLQFAAIVIPDVPAVALRGI
ncbi:MAG: anaerobic ribonucleoside-triphosphate reductase activating protein [Lachnospiraceae bacterium]